MTIAISPKGPMRAARVAAWVVASAAGVAGAWFSYDFGAQLGGVLMGLVAAANGAAMSALLASAVLDRLGRRGPG
jgi:drug/metabolite transporter (DMT)-like permease